jgi:hypothetical protein
MPSSAIAIGSGGTGSASGAVVRGAGAGAASTDGGITGGGIGCATGGCRRAQPAAVRHSKTNTTTPLAIPLRISLPFLSCSLDERIESLAMIEISAASSTTTA